MKKKILVVEDDNLVSTIFKMFLVELDYDLIGVVENGKEAIKQCEVLQPDIILMDVHLGEDLDGIQTTEIIKRKFDIPVIFLSSDTENETIQRVISTHSYGYLVKPIDKQRLGISIELAFYKHQFDLEQKMREKRYRNFITKLPEAIIVVNESGIIEYVNCLGMKLFRTVYIEDLLGLPFLSFVNENYKTVFKEIFDSAFEMDKGIECTHLKIYTIHKNSVDIELTGGEIEFNGKKAMQLILRDVTKYLNYRNTLSEKINIINNLDEGVIVFDMEGKIKSWNNACEKILGRKEEEVVNRKIDELKIFAQNNSFADTLLNPTLENNKIILNVKFFDKLKTSKNLNISSLILHDDLDNKTGLVCYIKTVN